MLNDLLYSLRTLRKSPGLVAVAILSLALGLGLNLTVFGIFESVFIRGVTAADPERTLHVLAGGSNRISYPNFRDLQAAGAVSSMAAYSVKDFAAGEGSGREHILGQVVAGDYFELLGVQPAIGRGFTEAEKQPGNSAQVAIVSWSYFERRLDGDRGRVGTAAIRLNGRPFTVIGVLPEHYRSIHGFAIEPPFYVPYSAITDPAYLDRAGHPLEVIARLRPDQSREAGAAALLSAARELERTYPEVNVKFGRVEMYALSGPELLKREGGARMAVLFFAILSAIAGLVLLIACANVAGLLVARAVNRRREVAIRLATGASRGRLIRLFLTEGVLLSAGGLAAALLLAGWTVSSIHAIPLPAELPVHVQPEMNWRVALYCAGIVVAAALFSSLGPALEAARANVSSGLKNEDAVPGRVRLWTLRNVLVVGQVALSLVLLTVSLLFVRSLRDVQRVDPGFEVERQLIASVRSEDPSAVHGLTERALERLEQVAGVESASAAIIIPLSRHSWITDLKVDGDPDKKPLVQANAIAPRYFRTAGIRLLAGREFAATDRGGAPEVAVVNEAFVRQHLGGRTALGRVLEQPDPKTGGKRFEVIGVVADSKHVSLGESPVPVLYRPLLQENPPMPPDFQVRTHGPAESAAGAVRAALLEVSPGALVEVKTMRENMEFSTYPNKIGAALLGVMGGLGLLLASVGLYGVLAYAVSRRVREIGVRMALGASRGQVLRAVLGDAMALVGVGLVIGLALASVATQPLASFLSAGVSVTDPLTLAGVAAILLATGAVAAFIPAMRALRVDPMTALRYE